MHGCRVAAKWPCFALYIEEAAFRASELDANSHFFLHRGVKLYTKIVFGKATLAAAGALVTTWVQLSQILELFVLLYIYLYIFLKSPTL